MEQTALVYGHMIHPSGRRLWAQTTRHLRMAGLSTALVAAVPGTRLMFASTGAGLLSFDSRSRRTAATPAGHTPSKSRLTSALWEQFQPNALEFLSFSR